MPELRVRRDDLAVGELVEGERLRERLGEGEAQLLVERFSLSANNVTMRSRERSSATGGCPGSARLGVMPAWGYARVVGSSSLLEGRQVFGLVPTGTTSQLSCSA